MDYGNMKRRKRISADARIVLMTVAVLLFDFGWGYMMGYSHGQEDAEERTPIQRCIEAMRDANLATELCEPLEQR